MASDYLPQRIPHSAIIARPRRESPPALASQICVASPARVSVPVAQLAKFAAAHSSLGCLSSAANIADRRSPLHEPLRRLIKELATTDPIWRPPTETKCTERARASSATNWPQLLCCEEFAEKVRWPPKT